MIVTGSEILRRLHLGQIQIRPYCGRQLKSASYIARVGDRLQEVICLGGRRRLRSVPLRPPGVVLRPGRTYFARTLECLGSRTFVVLLTPESTVSQWGLFVRPATHLGRTASGERRLLELTTARPFRIHPGMPVIQVSFWETGIDQPRERARARSGGMDGPIPDPDGEPLPRRVP